MKRVAILFAGQGAQSVGMGADLPEVREAFARADEILGMNLGETAFKGPEDTLTRTAFCQPALYVHGLGCLEALKRCLPEFRFYAAAGLSLGEFTAHAAAGTFSFEEGLRLVARRGALMEEACDATDGAMAAMIGADPDAAARLAHEANVDVANDNAPGQLVLSGSKAGIDRAVELAKKYGIRRAVPLTVAGAYHSRLMQSAQDGFAGVVRSASVVMPEVPLPANVLGRPARDVAELRESLVAQVTGTVRWRECMEFVLDQTGIDGFVELGPGGVLTGLIGRIRKGVPAISLADAAGADAAAAVLASA